MWGAGASGLTLRFALQGIVGNLSSGKSALVHRYLTGTYVQEESPEGEWLLLLLLTGSGGQGSRSAWDLARGGGRGGPGVGGPLALSGVWWAVPSLQLAVPLLGAHVG